jgi:hypothetical protein
MGRLDDMWRAMNSEEKSFYEDHVRLYKRAHRQDLAAVPGAGVSSSTACDETESDSSSASSSDASAGRDGNAVLSAVAVS